MLLHVLDRRRSSLLRASPAPVSLGDHSPTACSVVCALPRCSAQWRLHSGKDLQLAPWLSGSGGCHRHGVARARRSQPAVKCAKNQSVPKNRNAVGARSRRATLGKRHWACATDTDDRTALPARLRNRDTHVHANTFESPKAWSSHRCHFL